MDIEDNEVHMYNLRRKLTQIPAISYEENYETK
jgi:hypothetical protein